MTQAQALTILKTGANVFLSGSPGSGKTHTINEYVKYLHERSIEPAITASTGIAATHIGGMTIHSWSGIGIRSRLDKYDLDKIGSSEYIVKRVRRTRVLIIDEVSMLHANMLSIVDAVCREIKQNPAPFGGLQVVLVGDFFQLPPVVKAESGEVRRESNQALWGEENTGIFAYESPAWKALGPIACYLTEQHRQDDADFLSVLGAIRADNVQELHLDHIMSRQIAYEDAPENVTQLFSHNVDVDRVNTDALNKLDAGKKSFEMSSEGRDILIATLKKGCLSPENLELKEGASVMFTKNNPKEGFVNGTLGVIEGFEEFSGHPIVKTRSGRYITVEPMDWSVEENGSIKAKITQIPLRLAWAITVHKSQGMSMDAAIMDLSQVFEFGQGYVALSRVRRLSGLYLLGMSDRALKVHPEILEKDADFQAHSLEAEVAFAKISESEIQKMHDNFIVAIGGKIKLAGKVSGKKDEEKKKGTGFDEIRKKHPNAYRSWDKDQDEKLRELYALGTAVPELMKEFGRKRGAITARLEKLGLTASVGV